MTCVLVFNVKSPNLFLLLLLKLTGADAVAAARTRASAHYHTQSQQCMHVLNIQTMLLR